MPGHRLRSLALLVIGALTSGASVASVGVHTLRGIDRINVVVEDLNSDSTNFGVTEDLLRSRIESVLKLAKIAVVAPGEQGESNKEFVPILYLSVNTAKADGFEEFIIHLELLQAVTLARDPAIKASSATTWSGLRFARVQVSDYANKVGTLLTIMMGEFLEDYLSANPK